ncbi:hypothetical protein [Flavobacterium sp.]|uniref:hypothetical protein n=1 Tax=Flavobacterium sp. TaxID=239 RepID=UPI00286A5995|nr:hypothetical protein [Flavobacterium sp.]
MFENLRFFIVYLALLSGICGLISWNKLPNSKAKLILVSIGFSVLVEIVGRNFTKWTGLLNYGVFNIYILAIFSIYIIILRMLLKKASYKNISSILLLLFFGFYAFNYMIFQQDFDQILTNSYVLGVLIIIILGFLYLLELFSSNLVLNYRKSIFFWFVLGILIFHVPFLPFMLSLHWFLIDYNPSIYGLILFFLNLLMNICFIIGFLCSEKKYNY